MNTEKLFTSACRCCTFYSPEGRRGGMCQQLGVPVKGCWKACSLAAHPFTKSSWQDWDAEIVYLEHSLSLSCSEVGCSEETQESSLTSPLPVTSQSQTA
ncbi:hypothetical protein [Spirulina sp. 06S082]|uniref:hypothetical protein n=1 Tax=Spirulina sp. 06S082 TaxID=3110248 RepID=UPI002B20F2F6|nr:hypothetical protein [Spirulina sp. 06S082]MEA5469548.1 hypothetical protein [Spirulina sp. 06S082]